MNDHEADRIAAAMHQLRPDWPASSVRTLIKKHLMDRPRRDVTVALAWVACEAASHTPKRVLELGPWWQAAGVEGAVTTRPEKLERHERCTACGNGETDRLHTSGDHPFYRPGSAPDFDVAAIVADLKTQVQPLAPPVPRKTLDDYARDPKVLKLREEMAAAQAALAPPPPAAGTGPTSEEGAG